MSGNFKRFIYTIVTIFIVVLIANLFIKILPWLLILGVITYIGIKIRSFIKDNKLKHKSQDSSINNEYSKQSDYKDSDDEYTGEVIDVDYEEVDKKND